MRKLFSKLFLAASVLLDLVDGHNRGRVKLPASTLNVRETTAPPA